MEILFDIFLKLHSVLRTRLPDPWTFIKLQRNEKLTIFINNITYFIAYSAFLTWFAEVSISRLQEICGKRLEIKEKLCAVVVSLVCATHLLWPILLFFTHFFTNGFYPWTISVVVLLLHIYFMTETFEIVRLKISTKIFLLKIHLQRIFPFEWRIASRALRRIIEDFIAKYGTFHYILNGGIVSSSEESDTRPSSMSHMQPRLKVEEDYRPPASPLMQPVIEPDEQHDSYIPSKTPVIQPSIASKEQHKSYRPYEAFLTQPRIIYREQREFYRQYEAPIIQPRIAPEVLYESYKQSNTFNIQHHILPEKLRTSSEPFVIQPLSDLKDVQKQSETTSTQSSTSQFESKLKNKGCRARVCRTAGEDASKSGSGCFINSGFPMTLRRTRNKYVRRTTESTKCESQTEDQVKCKDQPTSRKKKRISKPRD